MTWVVDEIFLKLKKNKMESIAQIRALTFKCHV